MHRALSLLLLFGATLAAIATPPPDLGRARYFAIGPTGEDGSMSDGERQLRALLKRPDTTPKLLQLLQSASPEGQLYALAGLRVSDRAGFDRVIATFLRRDDQVTSFVGCIGSDEPMRVVAQRIADGKYDSDLQRPPW